MAIKRDYSANETRFALAIQNAYIRVRDIQLDDLDRVTFVVDWWASRAWAKSGQKMPWRSERMAAEGLVFDHSGGNPKSQIYAWLKTQPEFVVAVDAQD